MAATLSENDKSELKDLLIKLVSIPSVNTTSDSAHIPEEDIFRFIVNYLNQIGLDVKIMRMPNGRPNVFARRDGITHKKSLLLTAHMDTVNVDGMVVDPFLAKIENGRIFGRGTCDTKASLAIYLWLMKKIQPFAETLDRDIQFLATCDEENGCIGSSWLAEQNFTADEIIVGEPTENIVAVAHRGAMVLKFETVGLSAHASVPENGNNAVDQMCDLMTHIRKEWIPKFTSAVDPILGHSTASFTIIQGGNRYNIIPEKCEATMDIRYLPSQSSAKILEELNHHLTELRETKNINARLKCEDNKSPLATDPSNPFVKRLLASASKIKGGLAEPGGLPFMTDASPLSRSGQPCVVFGPGSITHAHSRDEFLEVDQFYAAAEILQDFVFGFK
jgi:acetylornithine deacetylase/succinyl-diaminopimelate desuccinylase family protein